MPDHGGAAMRAAMYSSLSRAASELHRVAVLIDKPSNSARTGAGRPAGPQPPAPPARCPSPDPATDAGPHHGHTRAPGAHTGRSDVRPHFGAALAPPPACRRRRRRTPRTPRLLRTPKDIAATAHAIEISRSYFGQSGQVACCQLHCLTRRATPFSVSCTYKSWVG